MTMHPDSHHVRLGAVVEGRPNPMRHRSGKRVAISGQPIGARDHRLLPDNQPGSSVNGIKTQIVAAQLEKS